MTPEPETRLTTREITLYALERKCAAPGCDEWFEPLRGDHKCCSNACRQALFQKNRREKCSTGSE